MAYNQDHDATMRGLRADILSAVVNGLGKLALAGAGIALIVHLYADDLAPLWRRIAAHLL